MKPTSNVVAQPAKITAQVVVRDKDGNVKYAGPLVLEVAQDNRKENEDGSHS